MRVFIFLFFYFLCGTVFGDSYKGSVFFGVDDQVSVNIEEDPFTDEIKVTVSKREEAIFQGYYTISISCDSRKGVSLLLRSPQDLGTELYVKSRAGKSAVDEAEWVVFFDGKSAFHPSPKNLVFNILEYNKLAVRFTVSVPKHWKKLLSVDVDDVTETVVFDFVDFNGRGNEVSRICRSHSYGAS